MEYAIEEQIGGHWATLDDGFFIEEEAAEAIKAYASEAKYGEAFRLVRKEVLAEYKLELTKTIPINETTT